VKKNMKKKVVHILLDYRPFQVCRPSNDNLESGGRVEGMGFASVGQVNCFQQKRSPLAHGLPFCVGSNLSGFNTSEHFFPCKKAFFSFDSERKKGPQVMMIKAVSKYTTKTPHVFIHSPPGLEPSSIM